MTLEQFIKENEKVLRTITLSDKINLYQFLNRLEWATPEHVEKLHYIMCCFNAAEEHCRTDGF